MVIWLVGMSGVGKSTIADKILQHISDEGNVNIVPLDGDIVRLIDGNNKKDIEMSSHKKTPLFYTKALAKI